MNLLQLLLAALTSVQERNPVPKLDGKIVGGTQVSIEDYPYQVSVRIYDQHICGGSILDATTVLTAGHCVHGMDHSQYSVRVGNTAHAAGESVKVSQVIQNPNYNPATIDNDMAILKLATRLIFNNTIQPIALQPKGVEVPAGTEASVSGWGVTFEGSATIPALLRAVNVTVITSTECSNKYGQNRITSHMMCTQTLNKDACQGDSGGPLAANGKLIGVVSWGYGCARPQYPGVYAKVSDMYDWILTNKKTIISPDSSCK